MGIFDDMVTEVANYPATNVVLEIVEVEFPDDALNEGEIRRDLGRWPTTRAKACVTPISKP